MLDRKSNKVPDTHNVPQPGGIAHEIKPSVGVTVIQGSYKDSGDHGNGQNEDGAERVVMPPQRDPREVKPADPKTFN